jgi:glycosyltransferase involved in cell wall biosynthesis
VINTVILNLTIVTVAYDDRTGLIKTIESVEAQAQSYYQHVIVCSHMPDLEKLKNRYTNEKRTFVVDKDTSLYNAMNIGMTLATGDAIFFLNSGDVFFDEQTIGLIGQNFVKGRCLAGRTIQSYHDLHFVRPGLKSLQDLKVHPGHQGFVAPLPDNVSDRIFFDESNRIGADSVWMRENIKRFDLILVPDIIARFELGGVSNLPTSRSIRLRLQSKQFWSAVKTGLKWLFFSLVGGERYYTVLASLKGYDLFTDSRRPK